MAEPQPPVEHIPAEPTDEIDRADLLVVLDAGVGRFLQGVETEPVLEEGRFVGFRLVSLYPQDERMARIDLRPGDVVLRVNAMPIERPEQLLRVWDGLRVASDLFIEYQRGGERRELRFRIVD